MGLKSKVRTHTVTTHATLTTRGREILSREGKIDATKFILSDEEIDYTLWDNAHPDGTKFCSRVLEDTPLLEATPNRTKFNSQILPDETHQKTGYARYSDWTTPDKAHYQINIPTLHIPKAYSGHFHHIEPTTTHRPVTRRFPTAPDDSLAAKIYFRTHPPVEFSEEYIFTIENTNVVRFTQYKEATGSPWLNASDIPGSGDVIEAKGIEFQPQQINPKATTTITVQGKISGLTKVVSIQVIPKDDINIFAGASPVDVTDPKFY